MKEKRDTDRGFGSVQPDSAAENLRNTKGWWKWLRVEANRHRKNWLDRKEWIKTEWGRTKITNQEDWTWRRTNAMNERLWARCKSADEDVERAEKMKGEYDDTKNTGRMKSERAKCQAWRSWICWVVPRKLIVGIAVTRLDLSISHECMHPALLGVQNMRWIEIKFDFTLKWFSNHQTRIWFFRVVRGKEAEFLFSIILTK